MDANPGFDYSPIVNALIPLISTLLSGLAMWIGWYLKNLAASKAALAIAQVDESRQQSYNEAAKRSMAYAESIVGGLPKDANLHDEFVTVAAIYLNEHWPDLIAAVGLTFEMVKNTIVARLPSGAMTAKADEIVLAKAGSQAEAK